MSAVLEIWVLVGSYNAAPWSHLFLKIDSHHLFMVLLSDSYFIKGVQENEIRTGVTDFPFIILSMTYIII